MGQDLESQRDQGLALEEARPEIKLPPMYRVVQRLLVSTIPDWETISVCLTTQRDQGFNRFHTERNGSHVQ